MTIRFYKYVCIAVIIACVLILYSSIYPGQPEHALFWLNFWGTVLFLPLGFGSLIIGRQIWRSRHWSFLPGVCPKWLALIAPLMAGLTLGLVQFNLPQIFAFRVSRGAFEQSLGSVPDSVTAVDIRIGLYNVERYSTDSRGGIYFRVRWEDAPLDIIHYGFAYQPNKCGSPFGEINYTLEHLIGDWYVFSETSPFQP